jgi:hypothetical protein
MVVGYTEEQFLREIKDLNMSKKEIDENKEYESSD